MMPGRGGRGGSRVPDGRGGGRGVGRGGRGSGRGLTQADVYGTPSPALPQPAAAAFSPQLIAAADHDAILATGIQLGAATPDVADSGDAPASAFASGLVILAQTEPTEEEEESAPAAEEEPAAVEESVPAVDEEPTAEEESVPAAEVEEPAAVEESAPAADAEEESEPDPEPDPELLSDWSCDSCTLVNPPTARVCTACGAEPPPHVRHRRGRELARRLRLDGCELPRDLGSRSFGAHTVLVLDNSRSMVRRDVSGGDGAAAGAGAGAEKLRRIDALKKTILEQLIARQLAEGATEADRVSLIKMEDVARTPFALLPLDARLAGRLRDAMFPRPQNQGMYLPALARLRQLLQLAAPHLSDAAHTNVLFLSDGRPSDWALPPPSPSPSASASASASSSVVGGADAQQLPPHVRDTIRAEMASLLAEAPRLRVKFIGFGEGSFEVLKEMAEQLPGEAGQFDRCATTSVAALGASVSLFSSRVATSRISSVSRLRGEHRRLRPVISDAAQNAALAEKYERFGAAEIYTPAAAGDFSTPLTSVGKPGWSRWPYCLRHSWPPRAPQTASDGLGLPSALVGRGPAGQIPPRGRGLSDGGHPSCQLHCV